MNPDHENPTEDLVDSFRVDTAEIAEIERLRMADSPGSFESKTLASSLHEMWERIHASPHLAEIVRITAELEHPRSSQHSRILRLIHGDEDRSPPHGESEDGPPHRPTQGH